MYAALAAELGARRVLDVGCGTGTFAVMLAERGLGDATTLPALAVDLATMTGNVAQAIVAAQEWFDTLNGIRAALRPGGHVVLETRVPAARAWTGWNRAASETVTDVAGVGPVRRWVELIEVAPPLVSFRWSYVFAADGAVLTSDSTLRFRERDAPDRPGQEFVFVARRPE